jgi:hypothetical protein
VQRDIAVRHITQNCLSGVPQRVAADPEKEESLSSGSGVWVLRVAVISGRNLSHNIPYELDSSSKGILLMADM